MVQDQCSKGPFDGDFYSIGRAGSNRWFFFDRNGTAGNLYLGRCGKNVSGFGKSCAECVFIFPPYSGMNPGREETVSGGDGGFFRTRCGS